MYDRLDEVTKQHKADQLHRRDIDWLIEQASILQKIKNRWYEIETSGAIDEADNFYDIIQDILTESKCTVRRNKEGGVSMIGKSYRELLIECGYSETELADMTDEDCEAEYVEIALSGE